MSPLFAEGPLTVRLRRRTQVWALALALALDAPCVYLLAAGHTSPGIDRFEVVFLTVVLSAVALYAMHCVRTATRWYWIIGPDGIYGHGEGRTVPWDDLDRLEVIRDLAVSAVSATTGGYPAVDIDVHNSDRGEHEVLDAVKRHARAAGVDPEIREVPRRF